MLKGVHLTLLIGPLPVPIPAPAVVMDALQSVQVTSAKDKSGFQITFAVSKKSLLLTTLLPAGFLDPMVTRVVIIATVNGLPNVLMDGVVTRQELAPGKDPAQSTLTLTGDDLSVLMDVIEIVRPFPATPEIGQVYEVLLPYLMFGIAPAAVPPLPEFIPLPTDEIPTQCDTDLKFLQAMAEKAGYVFYIEPGPLPLTSIAYFGPDIRLPIPQAALSVDMDAHTNVESMTFSLDGLAKKIVIYTIEDEFTGNIPITIPVPNLSALHPPLGLRPLPPSRIEYNNEGAASKTVEAIQEILGMTINSQNSITVSGSLDVLRYGGVLRSRMLVGVRGAGLAYDGLYYVDSVTHNLKRGEYKQSFQLSRDGLISNTPLVPV